MSSTRTYGAGVRVGNWNEDKCHQEERIAQFLEKRKSGDLSFMKTTQRVKSATEPMPQNCSAAGVLSFGDSIVLANTGLLKVIFMLCSYIRNMRIGTMNELLCVHTTV